MSRTPVLLILLLAPALAGCASDEAPPPEPTTLDGFEDYQIEADAARGVILGIVVDDAIRPIAEAGVRLGSGQTTFTDQEGRFAFQDLAPAIYTVTAEKAGYDAMTTEAEVTAGTNAPHLVRITLPQRLDQTPYTEQFHHRGFLECSYSEVISFVTANSCVRDYTAGAAAGAAGIGPCTEEGCVPALNEIARDDDTFYSGVGAGWSTQVWEVTWSQSATATSDNMGILVSYENRSTRHAFADASGHDPVRVQIDTGQRHPTAFPESDGPEAIDPAGQDDLLFMINVRRLDGLVPSVALQQDFEVFHTRFYYAPPGSDDWSAVAGDEVPF